MVGAHMQREIIKEKLYALLGKKLCLDAAKIGEEKYFSADFGVSSFQVLELLCDVEEEFHCKIPDESIRDIQTVGDLIDYLEANPG